jgi:hypothetical protein
VATRVVGLGQGGIHRADNFEKNIRTIHLER